MGSKIKKIRPCADDARGNFKTALHALEDKVEVEGKTAIGRTPLPTATNGWMALSETTLCLIRRGRYMKNPPIFC